MKRFFFFAAVATLCVAACTKNEVNSEKQNPITFQTANYLTKVEGAVFPTEETFGTFAWTANTTGEYFIENKEVSYNGKEWTTATPYYWPKNQSVDFFSYYPYNANGNVPVVAKNQLNYNDVDFTANQIDFLYADKAVGYTDNADQVDDGQNAYEGVPTLFRHAGAKVKVNVILGQNEKTEAATGTVTRWDVSLKSVILSGIYTKGSCKLTLSDNPTTGMVTWVKPKDANGYNVWTPEGAINDTENALYANVQVYDLAQGEGVPVIREFYAMPQTLIAGQQKITLVVDIQTYRKLAGETDFTPALLQNDVTVSADLLIDTGDANTSVFAWEMNQAITYDITLGPAGRQITFDPAVANWDYKTYATNIDLNI